MTICLNQALSLLSVLSELLHSSFVHGRSRDLRSYISTDAPKLHLDQLLSPNMALNGLNDLLSDPTTPERTTGHTPPSPNETPQKHLDNTPVRVLPNVAPRSVSPLLSESGNPVNASSLSNFGSPTSDFAASPWSAAVGRATMGKSGRVIDKLQGDNDRLQREKKLAIVKLEEEVKRGESARLALESLQVSNNNLISIHESDKSFLSKKDRRIEELRADLEMERSRRDSAERATRESRRERDEVVEKLRREAVEDKEQAKKANCQYDVLSKSWKSLEDRYERQILKFRSDLAVLREELGCDKQKLTQLEVIMEQLRQEGDKTRKAKERLSSDLQAYKAEQEAGIRGMRERAQLNDSAHEQTLKHMETMLGQMRYIVNVKKDVRDP